jgi:hypothetical protein
MHLQHPIYSVNLRQGSPDARKGGKGLPFDVFYLIPGEALGHVGRLSPYSVTLPLTEAYREPLAEVAIAFDTLVTGHYKVVVPVHMASKKRRKFAVAKLHPSEFVKRPWWWRPEHLSMFVPETTGLNTPTGVLQPMCAYCTNSLAHIAGQCSIGTVACATHLEIEFTPVKLEKYKKFENPDGKAFNAKYWRLWR